MADPDRRPLVTVVLPVRNEARHLAACLDAVRAQDYPPEAMEILVVDGMSEDGTRDLVSARGGIDARVRLLDNPGLIVPTALNTAIHASRGEVIVRVDGHTVIAPDYVSEAVAALQRSGADVVGGAMVPRGESLFARGVALATTNPMGVGGSRFHYATREQEVDSVYMGAFRRDAFARFGLFDEGLVRNQDDEFTYRVREGGGKVLLAPAMRSWYAPRKSPAALFRQYYQYGEYKVRVAVLHPRSVRARHLAPPAFVIGMAVLASAAAALPSAWPVLVAVLGLHVLASLAASARPGARDPAAWGLVPLATLLMHVGYGLGVLSGCLRALLRRQGRAAERGEMAGR